jgi:hypothetical protein
VRLTGWTADRGRIVRAALPPGVPLPRQVFENNERRTLARTPNTGYLGLEAPVPGQQTTAFTYRSGDLDPARWDIADARVFLWPGHDWFSVDKPLTKADPPARTLTLGTNEGYAMEPGNRYFVYNVLALLDAPGEAFVGGKARAVWLWPARGAAERQEIVVSTAPTLILVQGTQKNPVRNVRFENLDLSISDGDVVRFTGRVIAFSAAARWRTGAASASRSKGAPRASRSTAATSGRTGTTGFL